MLEKSRARRVVGDLNSSVWGLMADLKTGDSLGENLNSLIGSSVRASPRPGGLRSTNDVCDE